MNLFNLFAKLTLDNSDYEKGLKESEKRTSSFANVAKSALKGAGKAAAAAVAAIGATAAALVKLTTATMEHTGAIDDAAKQLQITTTQYQEWDWIMKQIGADSSTLSMAFRQLATFTGNLAAGNADAMMTMQKLGISVQEFMNLDAEAQLSTMIDAFQGMEQGVEKTTMAQDVFGARAYQMLLPILNDSAGSVDKLKSEIHDLGLVMSEEAVSTGEKLGDKFEFMKGTVKQLAYNLGAELFPAFEKIVDGMTAFATGSGDTDEALNKITDGIAGIVDKAVEKLPELIDLAANLLVKIILGIVEKIPTMIPAIIKVLEQLLYTIISILPNLVASAGEIIKALIRGLLELDWASLIIELLTTLINIAVSQLPTLIFDIIETIFDLFTGGKSLKILGQIGIKIGEAVVNGIIMGFEAAINFIINAINLITGAISSLWTWLGIPRIPKIPKISIPRVTFMKNGGMFEDVMNGYGTAYVVAGEGKAEVVAQGSKGTGVLNVEQFSDAMLDSLERFANGRVFMFNIDGREVGAYLVRTINSTLKSRGMNTLDKIARV